MTISWKTIPEVRPAGGPRKRFRQGQVWVLAPCHWRSGQCLPNLHYCVHTTDDRSIMPSSIHTHPRRCRFFKNWGRRQSAENNVGWADQLRGNSWERERSLRSLRFFFLTFHRRGCDLRMSISLWLKGRTDSNSHHAWMTAVRKLLSPPNKYLRKKMHFKAKSN